MSLYDGTGFILLCKRLEKGLFSRINQLYRGEVSLTQAEFSLFLKELIWKPDLSDTP